MRYFRTIGTALTELLGALLGVTINSNETTSGSAFRRQAWDQDAIDRFFYAITFGRQKNHCEQAVFFEIEDCKELLLAYGFELTPPPVAKREAVKRIQAEKPWDEQKPARDQEATDDDPMSPDFDAAAWFKDLPEEAKERIVEWGVSIKMSRPNRKKVKQIADNWHLAGVKPRAGHGMSAE